MLFANNPVEAPKQRFSCARGRDSGGFIDSIGVGAQLAFAYTQIGQVRDFQHDFPLFPS